MLPPSCYASIAAERSGGLKPGGTEMKGGVSVTGLNRGVNEKFERRKREKCDLSETLD